MLSINYHSNYFPLPTTRKIFHNKSRISIAEIIWSAITVGRENWSDVMRHGNFSYYEMLYRIGFIYANLKSQGFYYDLTKTDAYKNLDPSEKSAISYFLGLTFTKWAGETFLNTAWLMHLDVYKARYLVQVTGNRRPDLFGFDKNRNWMIAESKGRSGKFDRNAFDEAMIQAKAPITIGGKSPSNRVASQIYFSGDSLCLKIEDPTENEGNPLVINVSEKEFLMRYYAPFLELIKNNSSESENLGNNQYEVINIREWDIQIGLSTRIIKAIEQENIDLLISLSERESRFENSQENIKIGQDGILVRVNSTVWNSQTMLEEPKNRFDKYF